MNIKYNKALWIVIILAIVMLIPFLGLTEFNTKGEPREAVVAYTMLEHGNWILYCPSIMEAIFLTNHHSSTGASPSSRSLPDT